MGKRSDFERVDKDFYRTIDPRAVAALAPHLEPNTWFAEPCFGEGDLAMGLLALNHYPHFTSDISTGRDALTLTDEDLENCDYVITNPPWSRPVLHRLINHLSALRPTWLLFDADWMHTTQEIVANKYNVKTVPELMTRCVKIVSVGRLIWIPGTKMQSKDSVCWYLFDACHVGGTEFVGR